MGVHIGASMKYEYCTGTNLTLDSSSCLLMRAVISTT